jgi:precorrin-6B methylase 2
LGALFGARSVLDFGLEVPLPDGADPATRVIEALMRPDVGAAISAWTDGPPRFRLAWAGGGKRRSLVMRIAQRLRARGSALVNDSREVAWTFEVDLSRGHIVCRPRADPRFTYRLADVPAASHPTVAAALAWVADPQAGDTVWDPFCGSGTELVECAHRSEGLHLRGTDLSADAIAIARRNVEAAHIDAASLVLARGDACRDLPPEVEGGVDVILCNPPLGRRIAREGGLSPLLRAFVDHGAPQLRPGGRIVMLSAQPSVTADAARRSGLHPHDHTEIDMGGFSVALQVHAAPSRR